MLSSHFVSLRKQVQQVERDNDERSSIPITIRQVGIHCDDESGTDWGVGNWRLSLGSPSPWRR